MSSILKQVIRARRAQLEGDVGFRFDASPLNHFFVFARRESERVCSYIMARDDRSGAGPIRVDYWTAPVDSPDDSLSRLGVGYKIWLGETFDEDKTCINVLIDRAVTLSKNIGSIVAATEYELDNPPAVGVRLKAYLQEVTVYRRLITDEKPSVRQLVSVLESCGRRFTSNDISEGEFEAECKRAVDVLMQEGWIREVGVASPSRGAIALGIMSQFHINALAPYEGKKTGTFSESA